MPRQPHHSSNYGGRRANQGRKYGSKNRFTVKMQELAEKYDIHPVELLLEVVNDTNETMHHRLNAAVHVLPYVAPKLVAVDTTKNTDELDQMSPEQKVDRIQALVHKIAARRPELVEDMRDAKPE